MELFTKDLLLRAVTDNDISEVARSGILKAGEYLSVKLKGNIFYSIVEAYRNKGYATQCAAKLLAYAFDEVGVPFINGGCYKNNIASFKVMSKVGMLQDAFEENGDPLFYINSEMYGRSK